MNEEIEVEIDATGKVTIRTHGIKGASCLDVIAAMVKLLGREESKEVTAEYLEQPVHERASISQQLRQGG